MLTHSILVPLTFPAPLPFITIPFHAVCFPPYLRHLSISIRLDPYKRTAAKAKAMRRPPALLIGALLVTWMGVEVATVVLDPVGEGA
jgi:hypothetical protein